MSTPTLKLYLSAPLEINIELEQSLEKKLNDVDSFDSSKKTIDQTIVHFEYKKEKSKKRLKKEQIDNYIIANTR